MSESPLSPESNRGVVLVVEDNGETRTAMRTLLELEQYRVVTVEDGDAALQLLRGGLTPSLILLDLSMPGKDGEQFRAEQLEDPTLARIPVIVYSGARDIEERATSMSVLAFLHKPIEIDELLELVARYCGRSAAAGELPRGH